MKMHCYFLLNIKHRTPVLTIVLGEGAPPPLKKYNCEAPGEGAVFPPLPRGDSNSLSPALSILHVKPVESAVWFLHSAWLQMMMMMMMIWWYDGDTKDAREEFESSSISSYYLASLPSSFSSSSLVPIAVDFTTFFCVIFLFTFIDRYSVDYNYVAARRHIFVCFMAKSAFWRGFSALAPYTGVGPI